MYGKYINAPNFFNKYLSKNDNLTNICRPTAYPQPPSAVCTDANMKCRRRFIRSFVGWPFSNIKLSTSSFSVNWKSTGNKPYRHG